MVEAIDVEVRSYTKSDVPFIFATWLRAYRASEFARRVSSSVYFEEQHKVIERILKLSAVLVAHPSGDKETILGYLVIDFDVPKLHFVYVKKPFRRFGVARRLFCELQPLEKLLYTHSTEDAKFILKMYPAAVYNPYAVAT